MHVAVRTGDGLSTGRKEKLGESAPDNDSGVPTELMVPGSGLDNVSNLRKRVYYVYPSLPNNSSVQKKNFIC